MLTVRLELELGVLAAKPGHLWLPRARPLALRLPLPWALTLLPGDRGVSSYLLVLRRKSLSWFPLKTSMSKHICFAQSEWLRG